MFWLLEKMYSDPVKFRQLAAKLIPSESNIHGGSRRLAKILAACGVMSSTPTMLEETKHVSTTVTCTHCNGTGKVIGIDLELVQQAKKRRFDDVKK